MEREFLHQSSLISSFRKRKKAPAKSKNNEKKKSNQQEPLPSTSKQALQESTQQSVGTNAPAVKNTPAFDLMKPEIGIKLDFTRKKII